jgi:hypothetical protein
MNDKDKEAFEKWFLEYPSWRVDMSRQESCEKAWQAACEYMQAELAHHIFTIEAENKKLREALEFYAKCDGFCADDECVCSIKIAREALKEGKE